jgi:DNA polymerase-3 subunit gamma/tau
VTGSESYRGSIALTSFSAYRCSVAGSAVALPVFTWYMPSARLQRPSAPARPLLALPSYLSLRHSPSTLALHARVPTRAAPHQQSGAPPAGPGAAVAGDAPAAASGARRGQQEAGASRPGGGRERARPASRWQQAHAVGGTGLPRASGGWRGASAQGMAREGPAQHASRAKGASVEAQAGPR